MYIHQEQKIIALLRFLELFQQLFAAKHQKNVISKKGATAFHSFLGPKEPI